MKYAPCPALECAACIVRMSGSRHNALPRNGMLHSNSDLKASGYVYGNNPVSAWGATVRWCVGPTVGCSKRGSCCDTVFDVDGLKRHSNMLGVFMGDALMLRDSPLFA